MKNCIFCGMMEDLGNCPSYIFKMRHGVLFLNHFQHYKGRCLYILNQHEENFHELNENTFVRFNNEIKDIGKILSEIFNPDLINYAILGNHIQHVHWHIIPRYKEDSNWGNPPWPYPKNKKICKAECKELVQIIRGKALDLNISIDI